MYVILSRKNAVSIFFYNWSVIEDFKLNEWGAQYFQMFRTIRENK